MVDDTATQYIIASSDSIQSAHKSSSLELDRTPSRRPIWPKVVDDTASCQNVAANQLSYELSSRELNTTYVNDSPKSQLQLDPINCPTTH